MFSDKFNYKDNIYRGYLEIWKLGESKKFKGGLKSQGK